jgi:hypothetical protein
MHSLYVQLFNTVMFDVSNSTSALISNLGGFWNFHIPALYTPLSVSCQISAKFVTCTVLSLNGTLVEAKMFTFTLECTHLDP